MKNPQRRTRDSTAGKPVTIHGLGVVMEDSAEEVHLAAEVVPVCPYCEEEGAVGNLDQFFPPKVFKREKPRGRRKRKPARSLGQYYEVIGNAIRGTSMYWAKQKQHAMAMVATLGPPAFFITLSADDMP